MKTVKELNTEGRKSKTQLVELRNLARQIDDNFKEKEKSQDWQQYLEADVDRISTLVTNIEERFWDHRLGLDDLLALVEKETAKPSTVVGKSSDGLQNVSSNAAGATDFASPGSAVAREEMGHDNDDATLASRSAEDERTVITSQKQLGLTNRAEHPCISRKDVDADTKARISSEARTSRDPHRKFHLKRFRTGNSELGQSQDHSLVFDTESSQYNVHRGEENYTATYKDFKIEPKQLLKVFYGLDESSKIRLIAPQKDERHDNRFDLELFSNKDVVDLANELQTLAPRCKVMSRSRYTS